MEKPDVSEEHVLEVAYRTASQMLRRGIFTTSEVPKMKNPDDMTALQLKAEVAFYNREIRRLRDIINGRLKPKFLISEEHLGVPDEVLRSARQEDIELIKKGIANLKKRRATYAKKLRFAKLHQLKIGRILAEAERLNREAEDILADIEKHRSKIRENVEKFRHLQKRFGDLKKKFEKMNLDLTRTLRFKHEIPRKVLDLA
jgi:DNA gyrase/topoisomerase IV subunit A